MIRTLSFLHRRLTIGLIMAVLAMKMLIPIGFMPTIAGGMLEVQLCTGQGTQTILMEIPGSGGDHSHGDHNKIDVPCAFSGLSAPVLSATDPILLAIAIAFVIAVAFRVAPAQISLRGIYLRPPPQGPPAFT